MNRRRRKREPIEDRHDQYEQTAVPPWYKTPQKGEQTEYQHGQDETAWQPGSRYNPAEFNTVSRTGDGTFQMVG